MVLSLRYCLLLLALSFALNVISCFFQILSLIEWTTKNTEFIDFIHSPALHYYYVVVAAVTFSVTAPIFFSVKDSHKRFHGEIEPEYDF